ncbi:MAG TPA: molybdopterin cofactor-binding domain-containing protein [Puia sp.]|nr:molybdopterin cofactor-binding domain-containing protein [Puia sp.]
MSTANTSRRQFLRNTGLTGIALTLGFRFPAFAADAPGGLPEIVSAAGTLPEGIVLMTWISIDKSGKVTLFNHRSEMGQGSFQAVPQMIAEELEVDLDQVNIVFAPGSQTKYGSQITGGSSTVRGSYRNLLRISACAREMLLQAAAKKWGVPVSECYAEKGQVFHRPTGKKFTYGDLVEDAAKLDPPKNPTQKARKDYRLIGQPLPRQDTPLKTNGTAVFGLDKKLPGMLYAVVERSPRILGKVVSFDDSAAKALPGVRQVMKVQRIVFSRLQEGVAVVADSLWTAMQARRVLKIQWDDTGFEHLDTETLYNRMREDIGKPGLNDRSAGDFDTAYQHADTKVEAVYETPYQSHACMEPLNCIAHVKENAIEIWGPIQGPDWVQSDLSRRMGVPVENVVVNMTFLGGGFGRKAFLDYPHEAAVISKAVGAPVQVVWTREDDMTQGPFRPGGIYACKAGLSKNGYVEAFETKTAIQNMDHQGEDADLHAYNSSTVEGLCKPWFDAVPNYHFADIPTVSPIPVMWWRSVYASTNGFAYESFMDELAHAAGQDPLEFRNRHLDDDRYRALIARLREISGWDTRKKNEGWGVAITECFSSIVGEVVRVSRHSDGKVRVDKVFALMDCGWYVNPDIIRQQVEGSIVMALGAATKHDTHFKDGMAVERNFDTYRMPRINEIPDIEVHVMENDEKAGGVGEPGLPPLAPALCNAIFDLTGKRIRRLPFNLDAV